MKKVWWTLNIIIGTICWGYRLQPVDIAAVVQHLLSIHSEFYSKYFSFCVLLCSVVSWSIAYHCWGQQCHQSHIMRHIHIQYTFIHTTYEYHETFILFPILHIFIVWINWQNAFMNFPFPWTFFMHCYFMFIAYCHCIRKKENQSRNCY